MAIVRFKAVCCQMRNIGASDARSAQRESLRNFASDPALAPAGSAAPCNGPCLGGRQKLFQLMALAAAVQTCVTRLDDPISADTIYGIAQGASALGMLAAAALCSSRPRFHRNFN